ncbi:MAG: SPFH domain-containing protein [Lachnospiraceae bacterium]|nr:SPFH domain-containing protein [Lachnospiraceae bacterium]
MRVFHFLENQLYSYVQLVTRELIGNYRLDEILEKKVELSQMLSNRLKQQQEEYFVEFSMTGIKDIILSGEISVAGKGDLVEQLGQLVGTK